MMRRFLWVLPLLILLSACQKPLPVETMAFIPATRPQTTPVTTEAPSPEEEFARLVLDILAAQGAAKDFSDVTELYVNPHAKPNLRFTLISGKSFAFNYAEIRIPLATLVDRLDELAALPLETITVAGFLSDKTEVFAAFPTLKTLFLTPAASRAENSLDLSGLSACSRLENLSLNSLPLDDLAPLALLERLSYLSLAGCHLSSFPSELADLPRLTNLRLSGNQIDSIPNLGGNGFPSLSTLDLTGNRLTDISGLAALHALSNVYLAGNEIVDISLFSGRLQYTAIDLSGNQITDVSPLAGCFNAVQINLSNNQIADGTPITGLFSEVLRTRDAYYDLSYNPLEKNRPRARPKPDRSLVHFYL